MVRLTASPLLHPLSTTHHVAQHPLDESRDMDRSTRSHDDEESTVLAGNTSHRHTNNDELADAPPSPSPVRHPPPLSLAEKHRQRSPLPRSVRWRLSLGLLTDPFDDDAPSSSSPPKCTQQILRQKPPLQAIEEVNALRLRFQRSRYEELERKHYWSHSPVGIVNPSPSGAGTTTTVTHPVARGDDPLSALLDQEEKGSLFGFGGKRRIKKANTTTMAAGNSRHGGKSVADGEGQGSGGASVTAAGQEEGEEGKAPSSATSSRWADFYSTREMLDVIEKDLNRLPSDHYTVYHSWRKRCKGWEDDRKKSKANAGADAAVSEEEGGNGMEESYLGLESMQAQHHHHSQQQQQQLQQQQQPKKPFVRRKRFTHTGLAQNFPLGRERTTLTKLSSTTEEEEEIDPTKKAEAAEKLQIETSTKERAEKLSQILFVYAQEHEEIGYRQGMHEILSYILLVLEMDLMEHAVATQRKRWRTDVLSSLGMSAAFEGGRDGSGVEGGVAGVDSSGNIVVVHLMDSEYILHDAFTLFECVMEALASAYDIVPTGEEETSAGCLEAMTSSIVSKIRYVARDEALFGHVLCMPVPPQLYFAKWVRLMFGREVAGGMKDVMRLWDAFFELASATASMEDDLSISKALMNVLKTAAASMILLIRHLLLAPTVAWDGSLTGDPDPNEGISFLMNYPPIEDIGVFVKTITTLLAKEKILAAQASHHQESNHVVPTGRRHPLASSAPIVTLDDETLKANDGCVSRASSCGDFMGWPSNETEKSEDITPNDNGIREVIASDENSEESALRQNKFDVSEALGNFSNGLGTRTMDSAMSAIRKQPQAPPLDDLGKPLFTGFTRFIDNIDADHSSENSPDDEPPHDENRTPSIIPEASYDEEDPTLIAVTTAALNYGNKKGKIPRRRNSLSADSTENDEWCAASIPDSNIDDNASATSSYSKMSVSRSLAETIRKDPKDLASTLDKSVTTLMKYFHDQMRSRADAKPTSNGVSDQTMMIPESIWDAMADIDQVRKDLLSQSATEQLEKSPSHLILTGLEKKVDDIRQSSAAKQAEEKVPQKMTRRNSLFW